VYITVHIINWKQIWKGKWEYHTGLKVDRNKNCQREIKVNKYMYVSYNVTFQNFTFFARCVWRCDTWNVEAFWHNMRQERSVINKYTVVLRPPLFLHNPLQSFNSVEVSMPFNVTPLVTLMWSTNFHQLKDLLLHKTGQQNTNNHRYTSKASSTHILQSCALSSPQPLPKICQHDLSHKIAAKHPSKSKYLECFRKWSCEQYLAIS
jgi:hypothetical protein